MAGKEKIATDERVFAAAQELVEDGVKPASVSYRTVAAKIGGGSATTITASLQRWREAQGIGSKKRRGRPAAEPKPPASGLEQRLVSLLARKKALQVEQKELDEEIERVRSAIEVGLAELRAVIERFALTPTDLREVLAQVKKGEKK